MKHVTTSTPVVRLGVKRLAPHHLWGLAARLFRFNAERWKRRALFYERHRDCFPRLSAGRFIERCRELEAAYRRLAEIMFALPAKDQWGPVRTLVARRKQGGRAVLPDYRALISAR
ncbi:MAG: hypothetical protein OEV17_07170 [Nitrospira sp.]|nr:hypothetical protein [Nitrospira sp.]